MISHFFLNDDISSSRSRKIRYGSHRRRHRPSEFKINDP